MLLASAKYKEMFKMTVKVVEIFHQSGAITSTAKQVSPPKDSKFTLKITKVEVVEVSEVFCHWWR
jgi:hypothetical protein